MKSLPPESDNNVAESEVHEATDFHSLQSTAVSARPRERELEATDFHSLKGAVGTQRNRFQMHTATDYFIDVLTPLLIFVMVYALIYFLLDVRYIYTEVHSMNLRWVTLCFIVGIVAINRLVASEGSEESILYLGGLGGAVALYTLSTTGAYGVGSFTNNFMNTSPWLATAFNVLIVAVIWWTTNRLMHECCVDENLSAGDIGVFTGTARRLQKAFNQSPESVKRRDVIDADLSMNILEAYDPNEPQKPKSTPKVPVGRATERLAKRHPGISIFYYSVPAMAIFSWGLRVVQQGGEGMVKAGMFYMCCYTIAALMLLLLTSLAGLRAYFRARRTHIPANLGWFWVGLGTAMVAVVLVGASQLPKPERPPVAQVSEHKTDYWSRTSTFALVNPAASSVELIEESQFVDHAGKTVLIGFGLFIVYSLLKTLSTAAAAMARQRDLFPPRIRHFFDACDRFLQRISRLPVLPKAPARICIRREDATCAQFTNPMHGTDEGDPDTLTEGIAYAYQALCSLAYDLGVPREDGQTPYEFIDAFPKVLKTLREEAIELTNLYVQSAYAEEFQHAPRTADRLRKFWVQYDRVRQRVVK